ATRAAGTAAGSTASGGTAASSSPAAAKPRLGGEMKLGGIDKISDFDPHRSTLFTAIGQGLIMDQAIGLDKDFKLRPELVKSWEIIGNSEQFIFHLQPNAKWQNRAPANGRAVDAQDIAYNLMRIAGKNPGDKAAERPRAGTLVGMDKAEAIDPQT